MPCWPSIQYVFLHTLRTLSSGFQAAREPYAIHAGKTNGFYRFTALFWTSQMQDFNRCPSGHAYYFMQAHALSTESDREMSLCTTRGLGGADGSRNRQAWHLNNLMYDFLLSHDKCCTAKFNPSCLTATKKAGCAQCELLSFFIHVDWLVS